MSKWLCPDCGGGFPDPETTTDSNGRIAGYECPWCGREMFDA